MKRYYLAQKSSVFGFWFWPFVFGVNVGIFSHPRKQRPTGWHHILGISVKAGEISRNMCGKKPRPCISPTDSILSTNGSMLQCMDWNCHLGFCFYVSKSNYMCICGGIHPYSEALDRWTHFFCQITCHNFLDISQGIPGRAGFSRDNEGITLVEPPLNFPSIRVLCWLSRCTIFFVFWKWR